MKTATIDNQLADWRDKALKLESEVKKVIVGQVKAIKLMNIAIFARVHVLLEGGVDVGKTTLLQSITRVIGGAYERIEGLDTAEFYEYIQKEKPTASFVTNYSLRWLYLTLALMAVLLTYLPDVLTHKILYGFRFKRN